MAENYESEDAATEQDADEARENDEILSAALERFRLAEEAESDIRRLSLDDLEFRSGKQWPEAVSAERERDGRPCLVINRIPQFIQQITNDQRQNRPAIKAHPVDDQADVETAKVIQGLIRHIEYNSNADVAYDTAFDSAATGGFGYFRVITDFVSPTSFEQEILIKRIRNPFSVFFDPSAQEPDGSDASWALVTEDLSPEEVKAKFPDSELAGSAGDWESVGNNAPGWVSKGSARIAEYFYRETTEETLCLLSTGETVLEKDLPNPLPDGLTVVKKRNAQVPVIKWCKLNGLEVLEKTEWPGKYIPIIPVYGNELFINGKKILEGIVRNAKDSQRMYNYWASAETEAIALAPRSPFILAEGQLEGYEDEWGSANRRNHAYLTYKPSSVNGTPVPPPQRQVFEPAVQAITNARMIAADDLKATTGIYDAAMGAKSNETSGIAIQRRNIQAQTSNFHFIDNLTRSLRHAGRILIDLIPKIYDTGRTARIIGEDGEQKVIKVNQPSVDEHGKQYLYQLDAGKYDITVDVGPSFASKRQEAVASMLELSKANPQIMAIAGDLLVKNMDWPGAQDISERLKKTLPPGLADDPSKQGQPPVPPQMQAQMQQMNQMIEQLTEKLHDAQDKIENKTIELESRERIEFKKLEVQLEIERAKLDAKDSLALLTAEIASIENRLSTLRADQPFEFEDAEMAAQQMGAEEPQEFEQGAPGGMAAGGDPEDQAQPTGGFSPGLPMGNP